MNKHINLYASEKSIIDIGKRFSYVFDELSPEANGFYYKPCLIPNIVKKEFILNGLRVLGFSRIMDFQNLLVLESTAWLIVLM